MGVLAYFITISAYGTWLHGDIRGSVIKEDGVPRVISERPGLEKYRKTQMKYSPVNFDSCQREIVLQAFRGVCQHKEWRLLAGHVRSNHAHVLVEAPDSIEKVMNTFKAWATRRLREMVTI